MAERLGRGLQIRLQRFNSASHLQFSNCFVKMITLWGFLLGLPLLAFGGVALFSRTRAARFVAWFETARPVAIALTTLAWLWTAYEIQTFGVNIFREFFVGVPLLGHLMAALAFVYDHFWAVTPVLIYLTVIWMPQSLAMRAVTGILMLIPAELFKTTRFLVPDTGFAPVHVFVLTAYLGAIVGMYGMFYPWRLEKVLGLILDRAWATRLLGGFCAALGLALVIIGCCP